MTNEQKIIATKLGLLRLAEQLGRRLRLLTAVASVCSKRLVASSNDGALRLAYLTGFFSNLFDIFSKCVRFSVLFVLSGVVAAVLLQMSRGKAAVTAYPTVATELDAAIIPDYSPH